MSPNKTYPDDPDVGSEDLILRLLLLFAIFILGAVIQFVTNLVNLGLPYTVLVFVLGMLMGLTGKQKFEMGPHLMLNSFLPILIFDGAFAMDVFVLRKVFWQALFLAGPGLVVITGLTALVAQPLMGSEDWGWKESILFGSILSATDPVAVVALLKELGASPLLSLLIEGESLLNDGTAMVAFTVVYNVIIGAETLTAEYVIVGGFMRFAVGGPVFGYFMAMLCLLWLKNTFNDPLSEIAATFVSAFLTFFVSENFLHVSGVLAVVTLGVVLSSNRTSISPEVETFLHSFWEVLAYLANTLIFFLVGMIVMHLITGNKSNPWDFVFIFIIYISINSIRALVIIMFTPLLKRMGYKLPWQFIAVSSWSGLRGAVGLALALMVYETPEKEIPKQNVSFRIFLHLCGIVFLTLVINATTISKMLALLGMSDISDARREAMATSLSVLGEIKDKTMSVWMTDRFLSDVDWGLVDRYCTLREPWDLTQDEDEEKKLRVWAVCPHCAENVPYQPTTKEMQDMRNEAILRLLKAQKLSYWRQFEHGMLSVMAVRTLQELCEAAADVNGQYLNVGGIKGTWQTTTLTKVMEWVRKQDLSRIDTQCQHTHIAVQELMVKKRLSDSQPSNRRWCKIRCERRPSLKEILTCRWLIVSVAVVLYLVLDSVVTVASVTLILDEKPSSDIRISIIISDCLWGLMVLYSIVRLAVLKRAYVQTVWFWLSCLIFVAGAVDLVLCEYFLYLYYPFSPHQAKMVVLVLIGIRVFQNLHALEALVPCLILVLEKREVRRLSHGYDTGRGFVMGEEEIRSRIDHMADRKDIVEELRVHCDAAKMDILKCLGLMQKDNPEVAMGVKTRQAIRSVLNNLRDEIHVLLQDGLLEEAEGIDLAGLVESKMKKLLTAPPKVPLPSTEKILQNVPWVADNKDLILFIQSRAKFDSFEYGDVIMRQDEPTTGVSIILSGLVKLELVIPQPVDSPDAPPKFKTRVLDFLTAGNVLGELGVLTGNRRSATVKCETGVQLLSITLEDIQEAFDKFSYLDPPLKYRLWRLSAIRICTSIFLDQPAFHGMTTDKLRVLLENGYVEELDQTPCTFPIFAHIGELVLLHGEAHDGLTQEKYRGPCYVPQNVLMLCFETHQYPSPALFILPSENPLGHCRQSLSIDLPPGLEDMAKNQPPGSMHVLPGMAPSAATHATSTMGMSSTNVPHSYKRTVLSNVRNMDRRFSIQSAIRRGSVPPVKMKKDLTRSMSTMPRAFATVPTTRQMQDMHHSSSLSTLSSPKRMHSSPSVDKGGEEKHSLRASGSEYSISKGLVSSSNTPIGLHHHPSSSSTLHRHPLVPFWAVHPSPYQPSDNNDSDLWSGSRMSGSFHQPMLPFATASRSGNFWHRNKVHPQEDRRGDSAGSDGGVAADREESRTNARKGSRMSKGRPHSSQQSSCWASLKSRQKGKGKVMHRSSNQEPHSNNDWDNDRRQQRAADPQGGTAMDSRSATECSYSMESSDQLHPDFDLMAGVSHNKRLSMIAEKQCSFESSTCSIGPQERRKTVTSIFSKSKSNIPEREESSGFDQLPSESPSAVKGAGQQQDSPVDCLSSEPNTQSKNGVATSDAREGSGLDGNPDRDPAGRTVEGEMSRKPDEGRAADEHTKPDKQSKPDGEEDKSGHNRNRNRVGSASSQGRPPAEPGQDGEQSVEGKPRGSDWDVEAVRDDHGTAPEPGDPARGGQETATDLSPHRTSQSSMGLEDRDTASAADAEAVRARSKSLPSKQVAKEGDPGDGPQHSPGPERPARQSCPGGPSLLSSSQTAGALPPHGTRLVENDLSEGPADPPHGQHQRGLPKAGPDRAPKHTMPDGAPRQADGQTPTAVSDQHGTTERGTGGRASDPVAQPRPVKDSHTQSQPVQLKDAATYLAEPNPRGRRKSAKQTDGGTQTSFHNFHSAEDPQPTTQPPQEQ